MATPNGPMCPTHLTDKIDDNPAKISSEIVCPAKTLNRPPSRYYIFFFFTHLPHKCNIAIIRIRVKTVRSVLYVFYSTDLQTKINGCSKPIGRVWFPYSNFYLFFIVFFVALQPFSPFAATATSLHLPSSSPIPFTHLSCLCPSLSSFVPSAHVLLRNVPRCFRCRDHRSTTRFEFGVIALTAIRTRF